MLAQGAPGRRLTTQMPCSTSLSAAVARSTLADANESRDWRIYFELAQRLITKARALYVDEDFGVELANTVYALDATTIDLCLSMFPWAPFRSTKAAVKLHTLLDLRGSIPTFIHISDGKMHDVNVLDLLLIEAGAFYIMDRGYLDFERLYALDQAGGFFITRAKRNLDARRVYSAPVDRDTELICDQTIALNGFYAAKHYPAYLRRIRYRDPETGKNLVFLTNQFALPALTICALYRCRWQVELFFKWIKQHLRIKRFYGTSENAVRTQIWIAISVYVLVAIIKKKLRLNVSLHTLLQILSLTLFEKLPLKQAVAGVEPIETNPAFYRQLNLFELPAQAVDATQALNRSAGVSKPKVLRGRSLSWRATWLRRSCVYTDKSVPFGKYCRSRPLVFSLDPRCHGLWGSQK